MKSKSLSSKNLPGSQRPMEVVAADKTINTFVAALKNFGLFAAEHTTTVNMLANVHETIVAFIGRFDNLCFEIDKTEILYDDYSIYDGPANDENPVYVMYRDGLRWLEFEKGVSVEELKALFQVFHHYRQIPDEPEDDLVSALWRLDLSHVFYKASDILWDDEPALDFSAFDLSGKETEVSRRREEDDKTPSPNDRRKVLRPGEDIKQPQSLSVPFADSEETVYNLSPAEKNLLDQDIKRCIEQESRQDIIGLMLLILNQEHDQVTFEAIINSLKEELRLSLESQEFQSSYYLLANIKKIPEKHIGTREWAEPFWEKFYGDIVKPETLSSLLPVWQELPTFDPESVKDFTRFLSLLPPRAGETFAAMLDEVSSPNARTLMIEIISSFAIRDLGVLESLLLRPEEDLGLRLIRVVNSIENEQVALRLLKKGAAHQMAKVKTEAQKSLHRRGGL